MKTEENKVLEDKNEVKEISDENVALDKEDEGNSRYYDMSRIGQIIS